MQLSGIAGPESGFLPEPLNPDPVPAPDDASIDGEDLHYRYPIDSDGPLATVGPGLLETFAGLHSQSTLEAIPEFALKHGVLELCEHGTPRQHTAVRTSTRKRGFQGCPPLGSRTKGGHRYAFEPLARWMIYSRRAEALLRITSDLTMGGATSAQHWEWLGLSEFASAAPREQREAVATVVGRWLALGHARPRLSWGDAGPLIQMRSPGVFGRIGLSLLQSIAGAGSFAICSSCGRAYAPARRPSVGRRNYCLECRTAKIPIRDAQRARRARLKEFVGKAAV